MKELNILRSDISVTAINTVKMQQDLLDGFVELQIQRFALTSNNITYAVMGDSFNYWDFFPAHKNKESNQEPLQYGVLPVWGVAVVINSKVKGITRGSRYFGFFPATTHILVKPNSLTQNSFVDSVDHRADLPLAYNQYTILANNDELTPEAIQSENERMLLYPLHITSFLLYEYFNDLAWLSSKQVLILCASSKTAIGLAYGIKDRLIDLNLVGMTSSNKVKTLQELELYDEVIAYTNVNKINFTLPTVVIDMSGNVQLEVELKSMLGDNMIHYSKVGLTHNVSTKLKRPKTKIADERTEVFFAPTQIKKLIDILGYSEFKQLSTNYLTKSFDFTGKWLNYQYIYGLEQMIKIYPDVLNGKIPANIGLIINLNDQ